MKHEVKIPKRITIGGFSYRARTDKHTSKELQADGNWGRHRPNTREILIDSEASPQQISASFLHECLHAIDGVYCDYCLTETQNKCLASGLHQVFEQLKVRFVK